MSRSNKDWITSFKDYTANSEPPDLYKEWVAISVIASALQRKCYLEWGPLTFYPNMYVVLVGPSGKCRKGTAMGPGYKFLRDIGSNLAAEAITREALIRELKNCSATHIDPVDSSVSMHASLTIFSPELTVFLGYNNLQLMSDLTDWYDCRDRWTYRTKNMGTDEIVGVWVNLIGATTPELIQSTLPRDAIGGGLSSRIIFVYEEKKGKIVPAPFLTDKEVALREGLLSDLERIGMMSGTFKVDQDFVDLWIEWYTAQEDNPPFDDQRFAGYFERRPNHVLKLSMILSASEGDSQILTKKILERAIDVLTRTEKKMPYTFSGYGKSEISEVMSRVMAFIANAGETTFEELMKNFYYDADQETMQKILGTLSSMGYCTVVYKGSVCAIKHKV